MARGDRHAAYWPRFVFLILIIAAGFLAAAQPASAACYRLLQPNGWGYQTVCNNTGGGGGGGGGGYNYGAALGAGAAALGILQDLVNEAERQNQNQPSGGSPAPRGPSCRAGYRVISGGGCAPAGAVDCGGGRYCKAGNVCVAGNKCDTPESIESDRQMRRDWAKSEQDKHNAARAELEAIQRRLAQQETQVSEPAQMSAALLPPAQANPFARSGASAKPDAAAPSTARRPWSGEKADCGNAGLLEQNTAAWYEMCDPAAAARKKTAGHVPSIDPQQLTLQAKAGCGNRPLEDQQTCIMDGKLQILLRDDPAVRAKCSSAQGKNQILCVDFTYLYGPDGPNRDDMQNILSMMHSGKPATAPLPDEQRPVAVSAPPSPCGPGFGIKQTPGAFGGYSCQRLGVLFFAPDRKTPIDAGSPEGIEAVRQFEERIDETAAAATAAAVKAVGDDMNAADRETCTAESFAVARGVLKGGSYQVSEKCRLMVLAAQTALAHYAASTVNASEPGVNELLKAYVDDTNATAVDEKRPVLIGVEPTTEMRQQADCMRRGLAPDCANTPPAAPPPARIADGVCAQAETHWKTVEDIKSLALYRDHLARFPTCAFATLAAARIEQLTKK